MLEKDNKSYTFFSVLLFLGNTHAPVSAQIIKKKAMHFKNLFRSKILFNVKECEFKS